MLPPTDLEDGRLVGASKGNRRPVSESRFCDALVPLLGDCRWCGAEQIATGSKGLRVSCLTCDEPSN